MINALTLLFVTEISIDSSPSSSGFSLILVECVPVSRTWAILAITVAGCFPDPYASGRTAACCPQRGKPDPSPRRPYSHLLSMDIPPEGHCSFRNYFDSHCLLKKRERYLNP